MKARADVEPTGILEVDALAGTGVLTLDHYVRAVSAYVLRQDALAAGPKKAAQIRLSNGLARAFAGDLVRRVPALAGRLVTDERKVAGGLRTTNADVSESHPLDGLRLAVELKPINLAVGRAIWNRFGDVRTFAVNLHLKFPFAVVGGVLVIPIWEAKGTKAALSAEESEAADAEEALTDGEPTLAPGRKSTRGLIERAILRLIRAGGRKSEADAAHLLEAIAVVVYDPDHAALDPELPPAGSGLRWDEFVDAMATAYRARFED